MSAWFDWGLGGWGWRSDCPFPPKGETFRQLREICRLHKGDITEEAFILLWQPEKHSSSVVRNPLRTIDFFSVILCPKTLNTIPMMVLRAIRGEGSKTQVYVSSSFFVCLKVGQKKKTSLTNFRCSHSLMFCHSLWNEGGFCLPVSLTSSSGLKPVVASACFSCALVCSVVLGSYILCSGLNHLFPFDCQEQTQIFRLCWSFLLLISSSEARKGLVPHC